MKLNEDSADAGTYVVSTASLACSDSGDPCLGLLSLLPSPFFRVPWETFSAAPYHGYWPPPQPSVPVASGEAAWSFFNTDMNPEPRARELKHQVVQTLEDVIREKKKESHLSASLSRLARQRCVYSCACVYLHLCVCVHMHVCACVYVQISFLRF